MSESTTSAMRRSAKRLRAVNSLLWEVVKLELLLIVSIFAGVAAWGVITGSIAGVF